MVAPIGEVHHSKGHLNMLSPLFLCKTGKEEGSSMFSYAVSTGIRLVKLKDKAHMKAAPVGKLCLGKRGDIHPPMDIVPQSVLSIPAIRLSSVSCLTLKGP